MLQLCMNDPHVDRLVYSLVTDGTVEFAEPTPVELETGAFRLRLEDGELTAEMLEHHAQVASARDVVDPYLEAWSLLGREGRFWFEFEDADVVDRDLPDGHVVVAHNTVVFYEHEESTVITDVYPDPPVDFEPSTTVQQMMVVYRRFLDGRGTVGWMGYYCLTAAKKRLGGRSWWKRLNVSGNVADELQGLAGGVGDHRTGRKVGDGIDHRAHTSAETNWIKRAVEALITRLGQWERDPGREWSEKLTMADLPSLPE